MWRSMPILLFLIAVLTGAQAVLMSWGASLTMMGEYYYAVIKNDSYISIKSDNGTFEACDLKLNDSHVGRIQVAGIERKILLLYKQNTMTLKILQLDPFLCLYNPLLSLETALESNLEPQIILKNNTLDIFLDGRENCFPCRFDVNGNQLKVNSQLDPSISLIFKSFIIKEFIRKEPLYSYAFVGNFASGRAVLKVLDLNFTTAREIYFKHPIEALATNSDSTQTWIGITYAGLGSPYKRILASYTSNLELLFETRIKHGLVSGWKVKKALLSINATGYSFINMMLNKYQDSSYLTHAVYNSKGLYVAIKVLKSIASDSKCDWESFIHNGKFCSAVHEYNLSKITDSTLMCYSY